MAGTRPSRSSSASKSETENDGKAKGGSMPTRKAEAEWKGNLAEGSGRLRVGSGAFDGPYSFKSRFEEGQAATNPEELIGRCPRRVLHDGTDCAAFACGPHAGARPDRRESHLGEGRRRVLHHQDRAGDRGRHSGHRRGDVSKECAGRQAELSRVEGVGWNGDPPEGKAALET